MPTSKWLHAISVDSKYKESEPQETEEPFEGEEYEGELDQEFDDASEDKEEYESYGATVATIHINSDSEDEDLEETNIPDLEKLCRNAYQNDKTFRKIIKHPKDHKSFEVTNGVIYRKTNADNKVICIPELNVRGRRLMELVIDQAHRIVGHLGTHITKSYMQQFFWWTTLGPDIKAFCDSCSTCQATKTSNQRPQGLLHALPIPSMPWSLIRMDFVGPFPMVDNLDYIWVVLCQLMSLVHLIPL